MFNIVYFFLGGILAEKRYHILKQLKNYKFKCKRPSFAVILLVLLGLVNLVGVFGPELAFDALWYHLTLPKIFLDEHQISFIPGGLLYYSAMPKLGEMYYLTSLALGSEVIAKFIHFLFGILTTIAIYKISRKYYSEKISTLVSLLFYSNLVVAWLSITAYIDLTRAFFEVMAFWAFLNWCEKRDKKWLINTSIFLGFAIATKLLAIGSLFIFLILMLYIFLSERKKRGFSLASTGLVLALGSLLIPLPWFMFSYLNTGSFFYPFFSSIYPVSQSLKLLNPFTFLSEIFIIFTQAVDPISPVYLSLFPAAIILYKKFSKVGKIILIYSLLAVAVWYFTPRTGGGRFMLAYLPVISLLVGEILNLLQKQNARLLYKFTVGLIILTSLITLGIRSYENSKYSPVVFGLQSKEDFLIKNLNFKFGDFYDTDGYFKKNITEKDRVLLIGFHNLFYVNFPFIDASFLKEGDKFNYIAVQNAVLPKEYNDWHLVYENKITGVKLYKRGKYTAYNRLCCSAKATIQLCLNSF